VYCVFPGFEPQIGLWEPTVRAVVAGVPPAAAARAVPVTVAQRVGWFRLVEENEDDPTVGQEPGQAGPPVAPIGTTWGREGHALVISQARLAANVAARLIEQSGTDISPTDVPSTDAEPKPNPGPGPSTAGIGCNARAVVALWLAARASPQAAAGLRQAFTDAPSEFETWALPNDADVDDPWWGVREAKFALALLERPGDQVAQTLWRNWDLLMAPGTTLERLGELLGVQPPPDNPDSPDSPDVLGGGSSC
jgi:hypothetical protein